MTNINDLQKLIEKKLDSPIVFLDGGIDPLSPCFAYGTPHTTIECNDEKFPIYLRKDTRKSATFIKFPFDGETMYAKLADLSYDEREEWEKEKIKRAVAAGEPIDIKIWDFYSGRTHVVSPNEYFPVSVGDTLRVNKFDLVRVQKEHVEPSGTRALTLVLLDEYRDTYEEWKADQKAKEKAAQAEKNKKIAETRKAAGMLGGKALKGTSKQKAWAEEIRARAIKRVAADVAQKLITDAKYQHSKFWIENRKALEAGNVLSVM